MLYEVITGSFRVDVNVSIRPKGDEKLYTRVEIKNINSFRFIQRAIEIEVARQKEAWEDGVYEEEIVQETRLFDQVKQETRITSYNVCYTKLLRLHRVSVRTI